IAAGPAANILLTVVLLIALFASSGGRATTRVEQVTSRSPAANAGLRSGDRILEINSIPVVAKDIPRRIQSSDGPPLVLTVMPDGHRLRLGPVSARLTDGAYRLGFALHGVGLPLPQATTAAFRVTGQVTRDIVSTIGHLTTGKGRDQISSPVGIVQGSSEAVKQGTDSYLSVLALISLSIALLNLLPLLPLDGGHIAFAVVEGVRGRALSPHGYER